MRLTLCRALFAGFALLSVATAAQGAEPYKITISNHRFEPAELHIPAGQRVSVIVTNDDATPEEIESNALKVEKVIPGKSKGLVRIGPLQAGRYEFIGEYHADTAKGVVIVE